MKDFILVDVEFDISKNLVDENEFRNNLTEWAKSNNWSFNGFVGELLSEEEFYDKFKS